MTTLWYSATTADLTPRVSAPLGGYLARGGAAATGTHDPLTASLLLLTDEAGTAGVCWVSVDALGLDETTARRIAAGVSEGTGLPAEDVLVCSSHTHSGPGTWCRTPHLRGSNPQAEEPGPLDRVVADLTRAAARLPATRARATAGWDVVPDAGVGSNRYDPAGPHDRSTGVLTVRDEWGVVVAVLFDYACHPTVLGHANLEFSADYLAATRRLLGAGLREIEDLETPPVIGFLQGAAGDASTRFTRRSQTFAEAERQGGMLGGAVFRGLLGAAPLTGLPVVRRDTVRVATRPLPAAADVETRIAETGAAWKAHTDESTPAARIARTRHEGALLLRDLLAARVPATLDLPITVVGWGDVAWLHLPVEPFATQATAVRAASPFPDTRVIGYTDGYYGYLADAAAHDSGSYEALSSVFDPASAETVVTAATALLRACHEGR